MKLIISNGRMIYDHDQDKEGGEPVIEWGCGCDSSSLLRAIYVSPLKTKYSRALKLARLQACHLTPEVPRLEMIAPS